jgi:predicted secreted protein
MAAKQGRKINWVAIGLIVVVIILVVVIVWLASCRGEETTTTTSTSQVQIPPGTEMMRITEASNGKTITVSPGYILILQLTGYPSQGYQWDIFPPDPQVVKGMPGPKITPDAGDSPGAYTFAGIALGVGKTDIVADYVNPQGQAEKTFMVSVEVVSSAPTSTTTTTGEETTTTAEQTTTTTEAQTTTTTSESTTTTGASTTTSTATTTTTTEKPTTTTTEEPTTTSITLPPTTSTSFIPRPPYPDEPGTTYVDERNNGDVVYGTYQGLVIVNLGANPSTGYQWKIVKVDNSVLKPNEGDPQFISDSKMVGAPGVNIWTFNVLKADVSTQLALVYYDPQGNINQYFYVGIITTTE